MDNNAAVKIIRALKENISIQFYIQFIRKARILLIISNNSPFLPNFSMFYVNIWIKKPDRS